MVQLLLMYLQRPYFQKQVTFWDYGRHEFGRRYKRNTQLSAMQYLLLRATRSSLLSTCRTNNTPSVSYLRTHPLSSPVSSSLCHRDLDQPLHSARYHADPLPWWYYANWSWWTRSNKCSRHIDKMHECQSVGNKFPTKLQRPSWIPVVGACWNIPSKLKENLLNLAPPTTKKEALYSVDTLDFKATYTSFGYYCIFTEGPRKLPALRGIQNKRRLCLIRCYGMAYIIAFFTSEFIL